MHSLNKPETAVITKECQIGQADRSTLCLESTTADTTIESRSDGFTATPAGLDLRRLARPQPTEQVVKNDYRCSAGHLRKCFRSYIISPSCIIPLCVCQQHKERLTKRFVILATSNIVNIMIMVVCELNGLILSKKSSIWQEFTKKQLFIEGTKH